MGANASSSTASTSVLNSEGAYHGHQGPSCPMPSSSAAATAEHLCGGAVGMGMGMGVGGGGLVLSSPAQALPPPTVPPPPPPPPFRLGGGGDKKRKIAGLATLRKKLIRRRRSSKALDHAKVMREFVAPWDARDLHALAEEYEASAALKDLVVQADLARPPASTYKQDLAALYEHKQCTDVDLLFQGACFPVHRALLAARCPYFRELLSKHPGYGAQVPVTIRTAGIDAALFSALLRYLYTGEALLVDSRLGNLELLLQLSEEFGTPNPLEQDLKYLLETGDHADAVLVFSSVECPQGAGDLASSCGVAASSGGAGSGGSGAGRGAVCSEYGFTAHKLEFLCHKAILSARSPFFRNLIQRRQRSGEELTERALRTPTRIILDESVIPRRYSRVLLQALYLDAVDLAGLLRGSASTSSLSEVQAMVGGGGGAGAGNATARAHAHPTLADEAMEIYQIGRFLELDILVQGCEDIIVSCLTLENLVGIASWSEQAHGSAWVHRQALQFLREEFQAVAASPVLYELDRRHLIEALKSDFLQASELEVLQAVLKWGEHQLVKRVEEREPNLLCHTAHSVAKKGVKKRDLSDVELRDILAELLPLVRVDHVLPVNSEALGSAIRRGLVSTPPSHMIGGDVVGGGGASAALHFRLSAWLRGQNNGLFVKARLFTPYAEEVKALLDDQMVQEMEMVRLRKVRVSSRIPDTLYMVDEKPLAQSPAYGSMGFNSGLDVVAGAVPVPDADTVQAMLQREQELRASTSAQRAYALSAADRWEVTRQLQLRVAREFNLPDSMTDVLQTAGYYYPFREEREAPPPPPPPKGTGWTRSPSQCHPDLPRHYLHAHHLAPYAPRDRRQPYRGAATALAAAPEYVGAGASGLGPPPVVTRHWGAQVRPESGPCAAEGRLSDIIPDIAMATASIGQLRLQDSGELELDLGDRRGHLHSSGPLFL